MKVRLFVSTLLCILFAASAGGQSLFQSPLRFANNTVRDDSLTNLGATTVGKALFQATNPGAIRFIRLNADNSITFLTASDLRIAIGAADSATGVTLLGVQTLANKTLTSPVINGATFDAATVAANAGSSGDKFAAGNDSRIVAAIPRLTGSSVWSDFADDGAYIFMGEATYLPVVDSSKNNILIFNAGSEAVTIADVGENDSLTISPGETVVFGITDQGGGVYSLDEWSRTAVSADSITQGTLAGARMQPAGSGNSGAVTSGSQTIGGEKTFTGTITAPGAVATSGTFGTVRSASAFSTSGTAGTLRVTGQTSMATSGTSGIGSKLYVAADQLSSVNYIIAGEFFASFSGSSDRMYGLQNFVTLSGTGRTTDAFGLSNILSVSGSSFISNANGSENQVRITVGGTLATAAGVRAYAGAYSPSTTGTIGSAYGVYASVSKQGSSLAIGSGYGVYIPDVEATTGYGIYAGGADDTNFFAGNVQVNGNVTLGDASGDTLTINAGTLTAPNATGTNSNSVANVGTLDTRYGPASVLTIPASLSLQEYFSSGGTTTGIIGQLGWSFVGSGASVQYLGNNGSAVFGLAPATGITSALNCATIHMPNTGFTGGGWFNRTTSRLFTMVTRINAGYFANRNRSFSFCLAEQPGGTLTTPTSATPANSVGVRYIMPSQGAWSSTTAYAAGYNVRPTVANGLKYICTTAGTSGTSQPSWPTSTGGTVADGTATWTCGGADGNASHLYEFFVTGTDALTSVTTATSTVAAASTNTAQTLSIRSTSTGFAFSVNGETEVTIANTASLSGTPAFIVRNDSGTSQSSSMLTIHYFGFYAPTR